MVLIGISQMISDIEHLFMYLLAILIFSLEKYLFSFPSHFLGGFFFFFWSFLGLHMGHNGGSQARGQIRAAAVGLHHSHSHNRSELHL